MNTSSGILWPELKNKCDLDIYDSMTCSDGSGLKPGPEPGFFVGPVAQLLGKGSSPGLTRARGQKPGGLKGFLKDEFLKKNMHYSQVSSLPGILLWVNS